ncbi:glycosyltransferase [candidate division KSB1 bacterium]|nr:glycosyltransferase [candidate division KSB1 bacterium]
MKLKPPQQKHYKIPPVSIVVVGRNEEKLISGCLEALIQQTYPQRLVQIIAIDDGSTDDTFNIMQKYAAQNNHMVCLQTGRSVWKSRKKNALKLALETVTSDLVLMTDADCRPHKDWTLAMMKNYSDRTGLAAGFSPQTTFKKSLWNDFLLVDSLSAAAVSAGSIGWGNGVTCTGRNLSFRKSAFQQAGGFKRLPDTLSGDDDFILQAVSGMDLWAIQYAFSRESIVSAVGPSNWRAFLAQKKRHISASKCYPLNWQIGYFLYHMSNFALWAGLIYAVFGHYYLFLIFLFKLGHDAGVLYYFSRKLGLKMPIAGFLLWQVLFVVYNIISGWTGLFGNVQWQQTR